MSQGSPSSVTLPQSCKRPRLTANSWAAAASTATPWRIQGHWSLSVRGTLGEFPGPCDLGPQTAGTAAVTGDSLCSPGSLKSFLGSLMLGARWGCDYIPPHLSCHTHPLPSVSKDTSLESGSQLHGGFMFYPLGSFLVCLCFETGSHRVVGPVLKFAV